MDHSWQNRFKWHLIPCFQLEVLLFWTCVFFCSGSFSWQKQRGFWQTTLIFFVSVWLPLINLQAYKVTAKMKSESLEADVDTSLFKSWAAEGLSSPWAMIQCLNEHPKFHTACGAGNLDSVGKLACCALPFLCVMRKPYFPSQTYGVCREWACFRSSSLISATCCKLCLFTCSSGNWCLHTHLFVL